MNKGSIHWLIAAAISSGLAPVSVITDAPQHANTMLILTIPCLMVGKDD
jgi:hypothetical protein